MPRTEEVFISSRREDASDVAGRVRDRMITTWHLSKDNVFMDVTAIRWSGRAPQRQKQETCPYAWVACLVCYIT
jgi:hypothetical protein